MRMVTHMRSAGLVLVIALTIGTSCSSHASDPARSAQSRLGPPDRGATTSSSAPVVSTSSNSSDAGGWQVIGTSVGGRPLRLLRLGTGPNTVLWIGGIHGNEPEGAVATAALPGALLQAHLARAVSLLVLEDANPDGRAAHTRTNANGVDLNRNFPARNFDASNPLYGRRPLSQPESRALYDLIMRAHPRLVIACHSWQGAGFINFDGPAQGLAATFSRMSGLPLRPSAKLGEATPGSLGSWLGHDLATSVLTIEWRRGSDPSSDWRTTRPAILAALGAVPTRP